MPNTQKIKLCVICYMLRFHVAPGYARTSKKRGECGQCQTSF